MSQQIPIFVVSLARAPDRRSAMVAQLDALGLNFEITEAVDGKAISDSEFEASKVSDLSISKGDLGCYLSHMNIYRKMKERNSSVALILEDDAELNPAFIAVLRKQTELFDFDICFLDSWFVGKKGRIYYDPESWIDMGSGFYAYQVAPPPHGTHAYLITLAAAEARLAAPSPIEEAIDWYGTMPAGTRFFGLVHPRGAWLNEAYSTISFVSPFGRRNAQPWHMQWRRFAPWHDFWNLVHPSMIRARSEVNDLVRRGVLPAGHKWRPLPPTVPGGGPRRSPRLPGVAKTLQKAEPCGS